MAVHTLSQDEWGALLDEEKMPTPTKAEDYKRTTLLDPCERGRAIADDALKVINGERQDKYGDPEDCFKLIGDMWHAYLKAQMPEMPPITPDDVANMMVLFKMARIVGGEYHRDSDVDLVGYALLGADIREGRNAD